MNIKFGSLTSSLQSSSTNKEKKLKLYNLLLTANLHFQVQMQSAKDSFYENSNNSGSKEISLNIILGHRRHIRCWLNVRQDLKERVQSQFC